jgi:ATP-dependent helicase/nuclease subunit A
MPGVSLRDTELPIWVGRAPDWQASPPPVEPERPERLAPSRPENVELGPLPAAASPLAARDAATNRFQRGKLIHALLQHLPDLPPGDRANAARAWLDRPGNDLPVGEADVLARETLAVLDHPDLAPLFAPGSRAEVPLTGVVKGMVIGGLIDRLAVLPARVLIADFKTNRRPPSRIEETPVLYLRQMAAYRAVLRDIFPDRSIACALVWTQAARVVMLPDELLESHTPSHASRAA